MFFGRLAQREVITTPLGELGVEEWGWGMAVVQGLLRGGGG